MLLLEEARGLNKKPRLLKTFCKSLIINDLRRGDFKKNEHMLFQTLEAI